MPIETITIRPEPLTPARQDAASAAPSAPTYSPTGRASFDQHVASYGMMKVGRYHGRGGGNDLPGASDGSFALADLLDVINPLQHIPGVSTLYRELTGDTIKPEFKIAGGGVFGGIIGVVGSVIDAVVQTATGKDIGQNMLAMVTGDNPAQNVAAAAPLAPKDAPMRVALSAVPQSPFLPGYSAASLRPPATPEDQEVMALFGSSNASAHASYAKANMLGYLKDVSSTNVL